MSMARLFALGVIMLFLGVQLRVVDTFVLTEEATAVVNERILKAPAAAPETPDPFLSPLQEAAPPPAKRSISPPRWLAYSFLSIGAILVLTCPLRK